VLDMGVEALFNTIFFMKRYGQFSTFEIEEMAPFELEIFYYMTIRQIKTERGLK